MALALTKQPMFLLSLLLIFIPTDRFGRLRSKLNFAVPVVLLAIIAPLAWVHQVKDVDVTQGFYDADPNQQISQIIQHPVSYIGTLYNTYASTNGDGTVALITSPTYWLGLPTPLAVIFMVLLGLFAALMLDLRQERQLLSVAQRWLFAGVAAVCFVAINTIMYVYFNPINNDHIEGVQGRYFLPILAILAPAASGLIAVDKSSRSRLIYITAYIYIFTMAVCFWIILSPIFSKILPFIHKAF
jgi:uncharacterized membrane protein